ncbi:ferredoxin [Catenovulum agarivorans DS-2]|uniref:Ferredoxin n=1 Tax=Catenovulum agarivorans DS-2 TaxID=1328313 RepID=W7QMW8_9ALTE|nr:2Fe-2S iron-sulfur cluster-binding protein [Catenovulum agarivorans]EWH09258.1 ferredoxin [Catenovulum agarivorans DS-2]
MQTYTVKLLPHNIEFDVEPLETIVEAALRNNIDFPFQCMQGTCSSCHCKLLSGKVSYGDLPLIFTDEEQAMGLVYACIAYPISNVELSLDQSLDCS